MTQADALAEELPWDPSGSLRAAPLHGVFMLTFAFPGREEPNPRRAVFATTGSRTTPGRAQGSRYPGWRPAMRPLRHRPPGSAGGGRVCARRSRPCDDGLRRVLGGVPVVRDRRWPPRVFAWDGPVVKFLGHSPHCGHGSSLANRALPARASPVAIVHCAAIRGPDTRDLRRGFRRVRGIFCVPARAAVDGPAPQLLKVRPRRRSTARNGWPSEVSLA